MNNPYGQHLVFAMPSALWGERSGGVSLPGVPLEKTTFLPGTAVVKGGYVIPSDAPGFGIEVDRKWLEAIAAEKPVVVTG
jgi:L-rhamnonate dehydratase